jgi:hypothetical protein
MQPIRWLVTRCWRQTLIVMVLAVLYGFAREPGVSPEERARIAARFAFTRLPLPELARAGREPATTRRVHPSLDRIGGWISTVGAAAAIADLDGDGLANDLSYVDARTDQVIVAPAPGTGERYPAFALDPAPLPYDEGTMAPMGSLAADMNEDGAADLLIYYWGRAPVAFLAAARAPGRQLAASLFVRAEVWPEQVRWFTNAAAFADIDGDGHADLIVGNYFPDGARILDAQATGGESMQHSMTRAYNGGRNRVLLWSSADSTPAPRVRFTDAGDIFSTPAAHGWTLALGAADLDGDLRPEIYFANDFGPDRLYHNRSTPGTVRLVELAGRKHLSTPNSKVLGRDSFKGMGVDFGDLNGDGILDIYVSNIASEYALEESHFAWVSTGDCAAMQRGIAPYDDRSEPLGLSRSSWAWESRLADFDNDGVLEAMQATGFLKGTVNRWAELQELAMGNDDLLSHPAVWPLLRSGDGLSGHERDPFLVRSASGRYADIGVELGVSGEEVSRGIATADVDGDGDLDLAVANQWEPSFLFRNDARGGNGFLGLHLLLPPAGTADPAFAVRSGHPGADTPGYPAIGAEARVHLSDGRRLVAQVDGGTGHSGKRSPDLLFGLGPHAAGPVMVELTWRDRTGAVHRTRCDLAPGWHTVVLGTPIGEEAAL